MSWTLAPSLKALFAEIDQRWPKRDTSTDGSIGDAAHSARESQHNPNDDPSDSVPDGTVTAIDIDKDGIDVQAVLDATIGDSRVWYVIHDRKIYSRTYGWKANAYDGSNPHTGHIHVSLVQSGSACKDTSSWGIAKVEPAKPAKPAETPYQRLARIAAQRLRKIRNLQKRLKEANR